MHRIAIIGNSHVAALKSAWAHISRKYSDIELIFYAARFSAYKDSGKPPLKHQGCLIKATSEELARAFEFTSKITGGVIDTSSHDVIWLYGLIPYVDLTLFERASCAVRNSFFNDFATTSEPLLIAKELRRAGYRGSLLLSPPPLRVNEQQPKEVSAKTAYETFNKEYQKFLDTVQVKLVTQPFTTLNCFYQTKQKYSAGSLKLDVGGGSENHSENDLMHMNTEYGKIVLANTLGQFC